MILYKFQSIFFTTGNFMDAPKEKKELEATSQL